MAIGEFQGRSGEVDIGLVKRPVRSWIVGMRSLQTVLVNAEGVPYLAQGWCDEGAPTLGHSKDQIEPSMGSGRALGSVRERKGESPFMAELPAIN